MYGFKTQIYLSITILTGKRCHPEMSKVGERLIMKALFQKGKIKVVKEKHVVLQHGWQYYLSVWRGSGRKQLPYLTSAYDSWGCLQAKSAWRKLGAAAGGGRENGFHSPLATLIFCQNHLLVRANQEPEGKDLIGQLRITRAEWRRWSLGEQTQYPTPSSKAILRQNNISVVLLGRRNLHASDGLA